MVFGPSEGDMFPKTNHICFRGHQDTQTTQEHQKRTKSFLEDIVFGDMNILEIAHFKQWKR